MRTLIIAMIAIVLFTAPASAAKYKVGDRAANIVGRDAVTNTVVELDDYKGKWIFLDFWATWCGPCMHEMPNFLEATRPLSKRDDFAVFSVSLDNERTADEIMNVVDEYDIWYPVTYDGGGWDTVQSAEWGVRGIPATFLINPQGTIVATNLRGESLAPALDFFLNGAEGYVPIGLRTISEKNDDGSVDVRVELSSPTHEPLEVQVDYWHTQYVWAEDDPEHENRPVEYNIIEEDEEGAEIEMTMPFTGWGDAVDEITIPAVADTHVLSYYVLVKLPGTDHIVDSEGNAGIWVADSGRMKLDE